MRREQPGSYETYMETSWMFLPGEPGGGFYRKIFGWIQPKGLGLFTAYLVILSVAVAGAFGVRAYSIENLPTAQVGEMRLISVFPRDMDHVRMLYDRTMEVPEVRRAVEEKQLHLAYVMPGDFFLTGLILQEGPRFTPQQLKRWPYLRDWSKKRHQGNLQKFFRLGYKYFKTIGSNRRVYDYERFVFVSTRDLEDRPLPPGQALEVGVRRYPALVVDLDFETYEVVGVFEPSGENAWGRLPMPNL